MQTNIQAGDPLAIKKWSIALAVETLNASYFAQKFIGEGPNNIIEKKDELEGDSGDLIQFDLSVQLRQKPVRGDAKAQGNEEPLRFYSDEVKIDQMRHPVGLGGKMTRKRTIHDLRKTAKARQSEYWASYMDQLMFMYLSGARGINEDYVEDTDFTGHAGNAIQAPDADHILYGGDATSKATIVADDKMTRNVVERFAVKAEMMRSLNPDNANLVPVTVAGNKHYVMVMNPFQEHDLRTDTGTANWLEIAKAAAGAEGNKSPIFKGGVGMINNVVLHKHGHVIRFDDYGVGTNVAAARAIAMGRQAGVCAYGTPEGKRFQWEEEVTDFKNQVDICSGVIVGMKKSRFNNADFGVVAVDTAAANPN